MLFITGFQALYLLLALALRPFISPFLNCLEVLLALLDLGTVAVTALAYKRKLDLLHSGARGSDSLIQVVVMLVASCCLACGPASY